MDGVKKDVGDLIRRKRKVRDLTQKELGIKMGVSEVTINQYESGRQNPTVETLAKFCKALDFKLVIEFE